MFTNHALVACVFVFFQHGQVNVHWVCAETIVRCKFTFVHSSTVTTARITLPTCSTLITDFECVQYQSCALSQKHIIGCFFFFFWIITVECYQELIQESRIHCLVGTGQMLCLVPTSQWATPHFEGINVNTVGIFWQSLNFRRVVAPTVALFKPPVFFPTGLHKRPGLHQCSGYTREPEGEYYCRYRRNFTFNAPMCDRQHYSQDNSMSQCWRQAVSTCTIIVVNMPPCLDKLCNTLVYIFYITHSVFTFWVSF